jgi:hypothetical protein
MHDEYFEATFQFPSVPFPQGLELLCQIIIIEVMPFLRP